MESTTKLIENGAVIICSSGKVVGAAGYRLGELFDNIDIGHIITYDDSDIDAENIDYLIQPFCRHVVIDMFKDPKMKQLLKDHCIKHSINCVHATMKNSGAEIVWNDDYKVSDNEECGDECQFLAETAASLAFNVVLWFITNNEKISMEVDLGKYQQDKSRRLEAHEIDLIFTDMEKSRRLEAHEIELMIKHNGESKYGGTAIEASILLLASMHKSTGCGTKDNKCFVALEAAGYGDRLTRGWHFFDDDWGNTVDGMFHIQCSEEEAKEISKVTAEAGGSLRENERSFWDGFWEFEIE